MNNSKAIIQALGATGKVNIVSEPNLLTRDNKKASVTFSDRKAIIKQTVQVLASANTPGQVVTTPEYMEAGLTLTVTPRINDVSNVSLEIALDASDFRDSTSPGFPDISTRKISTEIILRDNSTAILGGLIKSKTGKNASGIPGIVEVPVLQNIFGKTSSAADKSELLIFLTPHIINDDATLLRLSNKKLAESLINSMNPSPIKSTNKATPFLGGVFDPYKKKTPTSSTNR
ncbi:MAG: type II and III secretion system protein [Spirochaetia bacterium]|nr:type II and III secretion system protein [Spirochaetia bacterium]